MEAYRILGIIRHPPFCPLWLIENIESYMCMIVNTAVMYHSQYQLPKISLRCCYQVNWQWHELRALMEVVTMQCTSMKCACKVHSWYVCIRDSWAGVGSLQYGIQSCKRCECQLWSLKDKISSGLLINLLLIERNCLEGIGKGWLCPCIRIDAHIYSVVLNHQTDKKLSTTIKPYGKNVICSKKRGKFCQILILFIQCLLPITVPLPLSLPLTSLSLQLCIFTAIRMQGGSCTLGSVCACVWSRQVGGGGRGCWCGFGVKYRDRISRDISSINQPSFCSLNFLPTFAGVIGSIPSK